MASALVLVSSTKEVTNFSRLTRLLVEGGTKALRYTFDNIHPPAKLHQALVSNRLTLQRLRRKRILSSAQWNMLYPTTHSAGKSEGFDMTLLLVLLRQICGLSPPATGWNNLPHASDKSVEANIARVTFYTNSLLRHASCASVDDPKFDALWLEISDTLIGLGVDADTINELKTESIYPDVEEHHQKLLKEWRKDEDNIKDKHDEIEVWSGELLNVIRSFPNDLWNRACECQGLGIENIQEFDITALDDTLKKNFLSLLQFVKWDFLNPWSDSQPEFVVLTCTESKDLNVINCLVIQGICAFSKGDTKMLEEIQAIAVQYKTYPGSGFLMNILGVMFCEKVLYEQGKECFDMAKSYFHSHQDNLREAVTTLNQAVLHKTLGDYRMAQSLSFEAASLCHDIFMITTNNRHLLVKVLGRVTDMLEEFGNYDRFHKTLQTGVQFDFAGTSKATAVILIELMNVQLKETNKNLAAEESKGFVCRLFRFLDNPDTELMNAEVIRAFMIAAKIHRKTGHDDEACDLLKKLQTTFLLAHGGEHSLYGSLLYQIGCFFIDCEKVDEALDALKQAEEILIRSFGKEHHSVASCKSMLGSCFLLKSNSKEALRHLNEALATFRNLNLNHPEVGGILLKLTFIHIKEESYQCAQDTEEEALKIFISACGKVSPKTATAYFQSAMFLLKDKALWSLAKERLVTATDIFLRLGLKPANSCILACHSLVGVLQLSLKKTEEAEKSLQNVEVDLSIERWIKTSIRLVSSVGLLVPSPTVGLNRSFGLCAKVVSLVNLVHMKTGDERLKHLDTLVGCLEKHKTEELQVLDFAGQAIFYNTCKLPGCEKSVAVFLSLGPQLISSQSTEVLNSHSDFDQNQSDLFFSSVNKKHHSLFLTIPHNNIQGDISSLGSILHRIM